MTISWSVAWPGAWSAAWPVAWSWKRWAVWGVAVCLGLVSWQGVLAEPAKASSVQILEPRMGRSIFQQAEVVIQVDDELGATRLDLWLDGQQVGVLQVGGQPREGLPPPSSAASTYRLSVDFGEYNIDHVLEAVAWRDDLAVGRHRIELPRIVADDEVGMPLQQFYVTVTDRQGQRQLNLTTEDFHLRDDGAPQELVTFAAGDIPFTALLLVDGSASMVGAPLAAAASGVRQFAGMLTDHDEAKVAVVADQILVQSPWSGEADVLVSYLDEVPSDGGSAMIDALYVALGWAEVRQGRRVVIVLSDGLDMHSVLTAAQVEEVARRSQSIVYWLRLGDPEPRRTLTVDSASRAAAGGRHGVDVLPPRRVPMTSWRSRRQVEAATRGLQSLVEMTGGRVVSVASVDGIGNALTDIVLELRQQYALGYYPQPRRDDGSWRPVQVRVEGPRGWRVRTRQGYVDR